MRKIRRRIQTDESIKNKEPVIFNYDEVPFWYYKKPQSTYDFKGTKRVPIANIGGGKNEKARFTAILG